MNVWFSEKQTPALKLSLRVRDVLHHEQTPYQTIMITDTVEHGRMLTLDDVIQTNEKTEFVYHELMAHVPLFAHPDPQQVLVVGGGDGGVVREVIKHASVKRVVLVEIDQRVVELSQQFLPSISAGLADPRCDVMIGDGIAHVEQHTDHYDVIIVDSTDPVGPAVQLFNEDFYRSVLKALRPGGIMVAQTESPFYNRDLLRNVQAILARVFPQTALYWGAVPEYPSGMWTMSMGIKGDHDPRQVPAERYEEQRFSGFATNYYDAAMHQAVFVLPPFVQALLPASDETH